MAKFETSIATVCLSGDLGEKLKAIQRAGFSGIEIFEQDFIGFDMSPAKTRQMISDHGLDVKLFQPFRDFEGLPKGALRQRAFSRAKYKFETMNQLGCDLLLMCSTVHPQAIGGIDRCADDFAELGEIAKSFGVRVGYEALAWGKYVFDHRDAWEIVRRADHDNVGLILDSYHTLVRGIDCDSIRSIPGDKIFFLQLADAPAIDMDYLYLSRHFRNMPGEGDLNIDSFMDAVFATGYEGPISLEIFNDQFRRSDTQLVAEDGHRSLAYLKDQMFARNMDNELVCLPPPVPISEIAYVECDISEGSLPYFQKFLETIGFVHTAKHKTKNVIRFEQAGINLLLHGKGDENTSPSKERSQLTVSELALRTGNAKQSLLRAKALGASELLFPTASGETVFPGIQGVNQSVIRFVDDSLSLWDNDFEQVNSVSQKAGCLTCIDHIAQTMDYDAMLSWTLFYTTIFDMKKSSFVDVVDPDGIIKSQVVGSENKSLCLTLNSSDARNTHASRFLDKNHGAHVQHIAFATSDIHAVVRSVSDAGFPVLTQTENYYHDVKAKFGLADDFCEQLRSQNILYDEDEEGCFLHFYTHLEGTELFFEFIERRGDYHGFGAANAPYRLSAQRRMAQGQ